MITYEWESDAKTFLTDACDWYEKTAPTVHAYCDSLYTRMEQAPMTVSLYELRKVSALLGADGWMQPNYAANYIYHLMEECGQSTVGQAGF
jgi:hypothetical protein